ncbi:MAG: hypothetical protein HYW49_02910 [Deltaproteobacteria bacterium]|nr:hypothetical protein [Deltaproteobacteria bacterium]
MRACVLFILGIWLAAALAVPTRAWAGPDPFRSEKAYLKLRGFGYYSLTNYSARSDVTRGQTSYVTHSPGYHFELEPIPDGASGGSRWKNIRFLGEYQFLDSGRNDLKTVNYTMVSFGPTWWPLGAPRNLKWLIFYAKSVRKGEFVVQVAPSVQSFSELRGSATSQQITESADPKLLGAKTGLRLCIPVTDYSCLEFYAFHIMPISIYGVGTASLDFGESRSYGGRVLLDIASYFNTSIGFGWMFEVDQVNYTLPTNLNQSVLLRQNSPVFTFQIRL